MLRHAPVDSQPAAFMLAVRFHLCLAAVLAVHAALLFGLVMRRARAVRPLGRLAGALAGLVVLQLALGASTWLVKYSVPAWASGWISPASVAIEDGGWLQTHIITAHVATGSLMLGTSVALALYANRLLSGFDAERHRCTPNYPTKNGITIAEIARSLLAVTIGARSTGLYAACRVRIEYGSYADGTD